jgi:hypothetical protein
MKTYYVDINGKRLIQCHHKAGKEFPCLDLPLLPVVSEQGLKLFASNWEVVTFQDEPKKVYGNRILLSIKGKYQRERARQAENKEQAAREAAKEFILEL